MPSTHHHKLTRKELRQPDEFISFIATAQEFLVNNVRQVIISALVVAAVAGIAYGVYYYERRQDRIAGDQRDTSFRRRNPGQATRACDSVREIFPRALRRRGRNPEISPR